MRSELFRLPVLLGGRRLDSDLLWDFAADFYVERGDRAMAALLAEASDKASEERIMRVIVRNWLIDQIRKTDVGSVRRRIHDVLSKSSIFETIPPPAEGAGRWRLRQTNQPPWGGRLEDLVTAAYEVSVKSARWNDATRRPPIAARADLENLLRAILRAAGDQSLDLAEIVAVIIRRFPATLDPVLTSSDEAVHEVPSTDATPEEGILHAEGADEAVAAAAYVLRHLTKQECRLVPLIEDVGAVMGELGCRRAAAYVRIAQLKKLLRELMGDLDESQRLGALCRLLDLTRGRSCCLPAPRAQLEGM